MRSLRIGAIVVAYLQVSGCASVVAGVAADVVYTEVFRPRIEDASKLSAQELERVRGIPILASEGAQAHIVVGNVKGLACEVSVAPLIPVFYWVPKLSDANGNTPEEVAMMQLKLAARRVGANALLAPSCKHSEGIDWATNCFDSWVCAGVAVQTAP